MNKFIKSRLKSFQYAFQGIRTLFLTQPNTWIHLLAIVVTSTAGVLLDCNPTEWAILGLTFGVVVMAEAFNTALEFLTDLVSPDYHELAGKTKDVAAAGVLIAAIAAVFVAAFIFLPKIQLLFR
ncbi:MAG: diacylglycerol kinase family protein [Saprospiraceae bacterium]